MKCLFLALALAILLGFTSSDLAQNSAAGSNGPSSGGGLHGRIQSVTTTNFSVGAHSGRGRHRRFSLRPIVVHYNPDTVSMTVDGVAVRTIDVSATGKYATVYGTMVNNVLEATSITITSNPPPHRQKQRG